MSLIVVFGVTASALFYLAFVYQPTFACWGGCGHGEFLVMSASCKTSALDLVCTLAVSNDGDANVWATGCSIELGGVLHDGVLGGQLNFTAGSSESTTCTTPGTEPLQGSTANGTILVSNGDVSSFSGYWS